MLIAMKGSIQMKKLLSLLLALSLALSLTACGSKTDSTADAADAEHRHMRALQSLYTGFAENQCGSYESFVCHAIPFGALPRTLTGN